MAASKLVDLFSNILNDVFSVLKPFTPLELGVACSSALISVCFVCLAVRYCCGQWTRKNNKIRRVYGRIKDITIYGVKGKRKTISSDPFQPSHLEFQRRFEDELTHFLYLLLVDWIQPNSSNIDITFHDLDGKLCDSTRQSQYLFDYRWLLKHIAYNCRVYAHVLTKSGCTYQQLVQTKDPGWTAAEVLDELRTLEPGTETREASVSWACRVRDLCHNLRDRSNKRAHDGPFQDALEGEAAVRMREGVVNTMADGMTLVDLITATVSPLPKGLKEHYQHLVTLRRVYCEDYIPFVTLSRNNKRRLGRIEDGERAREVLMMALEEIVNRGGNDVLEIMATSVLPRFNYSIEQ